LGDPKKWTVQDAEAFGRTIKGFVQDLKDCKAFIDEKKQGLKELRSVSLKGTPSFLDVTAPQHILTTWYSFYAFRGD
jgi:hypothetical protein